MTSSPKAIDRGKGRDTLWEGTRFEVDYGSYLSQHNIRFERPPLRATDCLPIGNGDVALQVDASGSQLFMGYVMKTNVWDYGDPQEDPLNWHISFDQALSAEGDLKLMKELEAQERLRRYGGDPHERRVMPKPLGKVSLSLGHEGEELSSPDELEDFHQCLSLYDGVVSTEYGWKGLIRTCVQSFVHSGRNLIVLHVKDRTSAPVRRCASLRRNPDPRMPTEPRGGSEGQFFWVEYEFPEGFKYVMVSMVDGVTCKTGSDSCGGYADFQVEAERAFTYYVAIVTSEESDDPLGEAKGILRQASDEGYEALLASHQAWWHGFWPRSFISVDGKEVENLWYMGNYLLARASRCKLASWLLWAEEENNVAWNGANWDISVMNYLGCFISNHIDLVQPFYRLQINSLPAARRIARELYDCGGARFAHAYGPDGLELGVLWCRLMHFASAYVSILFWWGYLYTQDESFLREQAYPVMRESTAFYLDWLKQDPETGRYYMPPPTCPFNEVLWPKSFEVVNNPLELGLVKRLFLSVVEASEILGEDEEERDAWQEVLDHFSDFPTDGHIFLEYEGETPGENPLWTVDATGGIFPSKTVDLADPRCAATVEDHLERIRYPAETDMRWSGAAAAFGGRGDLTEEPISTTQLMCCPMLASSAAWLGRGDLFAEALDIHLSDHVLPNGLMGEDRAVSPYDPTKNLPAFALSENIGDFIGAVNEALLQSLYDGVIEVFKGIPESWDARVAHLRAVRAFLVSSERVDGEVCYVSVHSEVGKECQLAVPSSWAGEALRVRDLTSGEVIVEHKEGDLLRFPTEVGHTYVAERVARPFESYPIRQLEPAITARKYIGLTV